MLNCTGKTDCSARCRTQYFGKKNFYNKKDSICEEWVVCGSGEIDYGTNKCVEKVGFTFDTEIPVKKAEKEEKKEKKICVNGSWSTMYELCLCEEAWSGP